MYLQKVIRKKNLEKYYFLLASRRSLTIRAKSGAGAGAGSGSARQVRIRRSVPKCHGSGNTRKKYSLDLLLVEKIRTESSDLPGHLLRTKPPL
jgi:hypothetical protein